MINRTSPVAGWLIRSPASLRGELELSDNVSVVESVNPWLVGKVALLAPASLEARMSCRLAPDAAAKLRSSMLPVSGFVPGLTIVKVDPGKSLNTRGLL